MPDAGPMRPCLQERCKNLMDILDGIPSTLMGRLMAKAHKTVRPPAGCEGHLTRREAAICLGLASEYKIRQFEREGRLHAVRGRMGTAFYPESEVLSLRTELARPLTFSGRWTDADLIALLRQPTAQGRQRTAVDLVLEARISISRAEKVYRFWQRIERAKDAGTRPLTPSSQNATSNPPEKSVEASHPGPTPAVERRSPVRRAHDGLVRALRDPDPRVRAEAFAKLKDNPRP